MSTPPAPPISFDLSIANSWGQELGLNQLGTGFFIGSRYFLIQSFSRGVKDSQTSYIRLIELKPTQAALGVSSEAVKLLEHAIELISSLLVPMIKDEQLLIDSSTHEGDVEAACDGVEMLQCMLDTVTDNTELNLWKEIVEERDVMSTYDVPGAEASNNDELAMGCWAEHDDGSLVLVHSTENHRIIYSILDVAKQPPLEWRDAMAEPLFKTTFSWPNGKSGEKWTWHDKTPFPWDRVIKLGARDGVQPPAASDLMSAAERVAQRLKLHAERVQAEDVEHMATQQRGRLGDFIRRLADKLDELTI